MNIKPLQTEKSMREAGGGRYTFIVDRTATKPRIAAYIHDAFGVTVTAVTTTTIPVKTRRFGRRATRITLPLRKKATVVLAKNQKLDLFETPVEPEKK
jgi:large subunit ribosomal protein L23